MSLPMLCGVGEVRGRAGKDWGKEVGQSKEGLVGDGHCRHVELHIVWQHMKTHPAQ